MENLDIVEFYKKEKNTSKLLPMYRNFYTEAEIFIEKINNITEKNNINSTYMLLKEKRTQKILIYLAYGKQIGTDVADEETDLYSKIKKLIKNNKIQGSTKIKINIDVPEVITTYGTKLGPYNKGEVIETNSNDDMLFIIENKIGEKLG